MALQNETEREEETLTEVQHLRAEVARLKATLIEIHGQSDVDYTPRDTHPWLRIAATVGVTFALGKLIQALRLPTATAVAIPMISSEINRRFV